KEENVNQFDPFFRQDGFSILINFTVNHSLGSQQTTSYPLQDYSFQPPVYPANYQEILDGSLDQKYLIGSDDHCPIELWVNDTIQARGKQSLVIVLRFAKIKFWKGTKISINKFELYAIIL
ncbi:unnamed protein product, partial [Thlaspi arvense]